MQNFNWKKLLSAAILTAAITLPVVGANLTAEAQPQPQRGNGDRYDRDHRRGDWDHDGEPDRNGHRDHDRDRNGNRNERREVRTLEGIVSTDRPGNTFALRLDNGQRVLVISEEREPRRLSQGDRVRVRGYYTNSNNRYDNDRNRNSSRSNGVTVFRADDVQITRNSNNNGYRNGYGKDGYGRDSYGNNGYGRRTVVGVVTNVKSDQRLGVRVDGRDFEVYSPTRLSKDINRGDYVRIDGDVRGDEISNARVVVDNGYRDNYNRNYPSNSGGVLGSIFGGVFGR